jgi:uncharacterized cofD-like protein
MMRKHEVAQRERLASLADERMPRERRLRRVVALGGGTGLPAVLTGLRRHLPERCQITAVVTVADDGGSSGILRQQYGVLPLGDIRNCLIALARVAPEVTAALQCRLAVSSGPDHAVGNLLLAALDMVAADEITAIRLAASLLRIQDVILPSTTTRVNLVANLADGRQVFGESAIPHSGARVLRVAIDPPDAPPAPGVLEALRTADAVILGPGSFYTSVLATLIVPGIAEAVAATGGRKIFVCNLMTEPGETDGFGVAAHLEALRAHGLPPETLDCLVLNDSPIPQKVRSRYVANGAEPVEPDFALPSARPEIIAADLLESGPVVRHDPDKLGPLLCALARSPRKRWRPSSDRRSHGRAGVDSIAIDLTP